MSKVPTNPHDCTLWLLNTLVGVIRVDADHYEGTLPVDIDFSTTIDQLPSQIFRDASESSRRVEFNPSAGDVVENLSDLLTAPRRRKVPIQFTVRELRYTHGVSPQIPSAVQNYLSAALLWGKLARCAEYDKDNGAQLLFIQSHTSKLWLVPEYRVEQLSDLKDFDEFIAQYFDDEHHRDQKKNIVRSSLLEIFKDRSRATLGELIQCFPEFLDRVKSAYALYTNDFSINRLTSEVRKQNQEEMLKLNKAFSDIQNQLLALPAAMLLAGSSIKPNNGLLNSTVLLGVFLFSWFVHQLVKNQQGAVEEIDTEVKERIAEIEKQPIDVRRRVLDLYGNLKKRIKKQKCVLQQVQVAAWLVFMVTLWLWGKAGF